MTSGGAVSPENRSNEADLRAMLDRFPPGEWFTASNSADEDNPWWIFAFDKWDDEDDSKTYPIGAVHCERGEFTAESELAEFIAAARNAIPSLIAERDAALARIAAVEADRNEWRNTAYAAKDHYEQSDARLANVRTLAEAARASLPHAPYTGLGWAAVLDVLDELPVAALAASPTPTGPEPAKCEHGSTKPHMAPHGMFSGFVESCPGPATPEPTEETK